MSEQNDDDLFKGPTLDASGRLENRFAKVETPAPVEDAPIELQERGPKVTEPPPAAYRAPPPRSRRPLVAVLAALGLGIAALVGFLVFQPRLPAVLLNAGEPEPVIISSEPPGAKITIDGAVIGQTPWAGENRWVGEPKVVLQLNGFRAWEGKLTGGKAQTLDVRLKK